MKKILILSLFTVLSAVFSTSCSDNEAIENEAVTQESTALRIMVNEIKKANTLGKGFGVNGGVLIFDFVYPITVSFNNGTVVTVSSQEGLMTILNNENSESYISGIVFPFQVIDQNGVTFTIDDEADFWEFLEDQDVATYDNYVFSPSCLELVYPLSFVTTNNQVITVANQEALFDLFSDPNQITVIYDFVYPFNVLVNNQTVSVDNIFEFYELSSSCDENIGCICPTVYDPVCVATATGQIQLYPNACTAECDGYTAADFVDCSGNNNIFANLGTCFNIVYPTQLMVGGEVVTVSNDTDLLSYLNSPNNNATLVFPINVTVMQSGAVLNFTFSDQAIMDVTLNEICN
jgi:hypothetical protein